MTRAIELASSPARPAVFPWRTAVATAAAVVAVLFVRRPEAFLHPQFWSEDASVFFLQAEFMRASALTQQYGGDHYFFFCFGGGAGDGVAAPFGPAGFFLL